MTKVFYSNRLGGMVKCRQKDRRTSPLLYLTVLRADSVKIRRQKLLTKLASTLFDYFGLLLFLPTPLCSEKLHGKFKKK